MGDEESRSSGEDQKFYFFIVQEVGRASEHFRNLADITGKGTQLILLDIPDNGGYYEFEGVESGISVERIQEFLSAYESKTLSRKQIETVDVNKKVSRKKKKYISKRKKT